MMNPAAVDSGFSLYESPALRRFLPSVASAFDTEEVKRRLAEVLLDPRCGQYAVRDCELRQATFVPGECCILRYGLEILDRESGRGSTVLVTGRIFSSDAACDQYAQSLSPLAARAAGREELLLLAQPFAVIPALHMVVSAFPIDGEMPMLAQATDPRRMAAILGETLPAARRSLVAPGALGIELVDYGRRHRVTLRYVLGGRAENEAPALNRVVYGKLTSDESGALTGPVTARLRESARESGVDFHIPESLGWVRGVRLALLSAIPGRPGLERALKAQARGKPPAAGELPPEAMVDACATMAAVVHSAHADPGPSRTLSHELLWISRRIDEIRDFSPDFAGQLASRLAQVSALAGRSDLGCGLCHGDFTTGQALFDGDQYGLVDFDSVCQGEPALDLGQFLAYLRLGAMKAGRAQPDTLADVLSERFLSTYLAASGARIDARKLVERTAIYRIVSLLRRAIRSWQKFKPDRVQSALAALATVEHQR
jgi:hypothetical protein